MSLQAFEERLAAHALPTLLGTLLSSLAHADIVVAPSGDDDAAENVVVGAPPPPRGSPRPRRRRARASSPR